MKWNKEILENAVGSSVSFAGVLRCLGLKITGGNYSHIQKRIKIEDICTGHFLGNKTNSGLNYKGGCEKKTPSEILVTNRKNGSREDIRLLKRALIESGVEYKCCRCGMKEWLGSELILEIHHKNGDFLDNRKDNLGFECPNCHSQENHVKKGQSKIYKHCVECGKEIYSKKGLCGSCAAKKRNKENPPIRKRKIQNRPNRQQLVEDVSKLGFKGTGRKYEVSDNCIRKWMNK